MTETVPVAELVRALVMQAVADGLTLAIHVNAQGVRLMPLDSSAHDADAIAAIRADERAATVAACVAAVEMLDEYGTEEPSFGGTVIAINRDDALAAIRRVGEVES